MSKTTNKFAPEVRDRAVRMVFDHERDHPSRWAAVVSIAEKIGCVPQTLLEWVKKAESAARSSKRRNAVGRFAGDGSISRERKRIGERAARDRNRQKIRRHAVPVGRVDAERLRLFGVRAICVC